MQKKLILQEFKDLKQAIVLLEASINKFKSYNIDKIYSPDELEYYDSLSFRFEKSIELTLIFFKGLEIYLFSKTSDTLRGRLLIIQKLKIIGNIDFWMEARLLRNKISHVYLPEQIKEIYEEIVTRAPTIFSSLDKAENYLKNI